MSGTTTAMAILSERPMGVVAVRKSPPGRPLKKLPPVSRDAQRVAVAILEVLAGLRTPTDAASVLSLTLPRYYLWEQRALEGLVRACEPRPAGKAASERHRIAMLEKEVAGLKQHCARQQALLRASQRTVGLATFPSPATKSTAKAGAGAGVPACGSRSAAAKPADVGKAKRKRRPVARALKAVAALQPLAVEETAADSSSANVAEVVQRSVPSSSWAAAEATSAAAAMSEA